MTTIVERVQTGVRIEKRTLKVLKALAEYLDLSLGDLVEGIILHAFEGQPPFSESTRAQIQQLRAVYGHTLEASDSHQLAEDVPEPTRPPAAARKTTPRRPRR